MAGWLDDPAAPAPGTQLAGLAEIPDGGHLSREIAGFPLLILRQGRSVRAFVNACPHQDLPLDYRGDHVLSRDGARLICTNHGAEFSAATGRGLAGNGLGCALEAVPTRVTDAGEILVNGRDRD